MMTHLRRRQLLSLALLAASPCALVDAQRASDAPAASQWETATPVSLGVDTLALRELRTLCARTSADACVVVRQGKLVDEWYGAEYKEPLYAMSSTKSVSSLLIGILADQGKIKLTDSVARFIPQWKAGAAAGVTVRHLLSMSSGIPDNRSVEDVGNVSDKEALAFGMKLAGRPGAQWAYSNNGAFLLSPIIKAAANEPVAMFAQRYLFEPLGMTKTKMHVYPNDQAWTHADMETTPRDLARIGQLMLNGGEWGGRQVVSRAWIDSSITRSQKFQAYGLMWWLNVPDGFAARGARETNVYVLPKQQLVIVRMQNNPSEQYRSYEANALPIFARLTGERTQK